MTSKQKEAKYIRDLKQICKRIKKEHSPMCKDKDFTFGCMGCQSNRFVKDFESYIDWTEHLYNWEYDTKKRNKNKA